MSAIDEKPAPAAQSATLSDVMLAMDVVDTLRHNENLVARELAGEARETELIAKLREVYRQQGIDVPDAVLKEGVAALAQSRFVYTPPQPGLGVTLARVYVARRAWLPPIAAALLALVVGFAGYFLVWKPIAASRLDAARIELAEHLPAEMDRLYQTIFEETKIQQATADAEAARARGQTAAKEGDRARAEAAIAELTDIRDTLRLEYQLRVVNRAGERSGFWTFPEVNTDATNYYVVVEAVDPGGEALALPILNEENNQIETVRAWGLRVPETVYRAVAADKGDDGIIQRGNVGGKQFGYLEPNYQVPVLGGAVTRW